MNANVKQFLTPLFERAALNQQNTEGTEVRNGLLFSAHVAKKKTGAKKTVKIPYGFNGKEYLSFLLHINAEIEHGLMVQYLYAAYSFGGSQVPADFREKVHSWQEIILGVAKEEMGHFISVQNILRLIGAPLNFARDDYPWDTPFYPFPFTLEPLTLRSLAKYVYAESPNGWVDSDDEYAKEIKKTVTSEVSDPHLVEALFEIMMELVMDEDAVPDEVFQSQTYPYQAKFDEWGRGYVGGERGNSTNAAAIKGSPNVLVKPLTCRDDAYNTLKMIAEQGEAPTLTGDSGEASHFERFLFVYKKMKEIENEPWAPARNVAFNPFIDDTNQTADNTLLENDTSETKREGITSAEAKLWGYLFNLRYRMLLNYLNHSFLLEDGLDSAGAKAPRGAIINATFGEMYNLRSIAHIMVQTPLSHHGSKMAGPPFTIPYVLDLPTTEHNRWRLHKDLLLASKKITAQLLPISPEHSQYLYALQGTDKRFMQQIEDLTLIMSH